MSKHIHQEVVFNANPKRIYEALMDTKKHSEFTSAPAEISRDVGGSISCHGGHIVGKNIELVPNQRIVQAWHFKDWEDGVYSIVKFELKEQGNETKLILDHSGVPDDECEHLENGWHKQYWEPLQKYLG